MIELFHSCVTKQYYTYFFTKTFAFVSLLWFISFITPILILFYVKDIWQSVTSVPIKFTSCSPIYDEGFVLIYGVFTSGYLGTYLFSSSKKNTNIWNMGVSNSLEQIILVPGSVSHISNKRISSLLSNDASKTHLSSIEIFIDINFPNSNKGDLHVTGQRIFLPTKCTIMSDNYNQFIISGLIISDYFTGSNPKDVSIQTNLIMSQTKILPSRITLPEHFSYNDILLNISDLNSFNKFQLDTILHEASNRDVSFQLQNVEYISTMDSATVKESNYTTHMVVHFPEQELLFETSLINQIKWAYIYYISIWIVIIWPVKWLKRLVFEKNILSDNMNQFHLPPNGICSK